MQQILLDCQEEEAAAANEYEYEYEYEYENEYEYEYLCIIIYRHTHTVAHTHCGTHTLWHTHCRTLAPGPESVSVRKCALFDMCRAHDSHTHSKGGRRGAGAGAEGRGGLEGGCHRVLLTCLALCEG